MKIIKYFLFLFFNIPLVLIYGTLSIISINLDKSYATSSYPGVLTFSQKLTSFVSYPVALIIILVIFSMVFNYLLRKINTETLSTIKFLIPIITIEMFVFIYIFYKEIFCVT